MAKQPPNITFRLDPELRVEFGKMCDQWMISKSTFLRNLIMQVVELHKLGVHPAQMQIVQKPPVSDAKKGRSERRAS
jgi:hypothetical protein